MSVIINEFEIISKSQEASQEAPSEVSGVTPADIINIIRYRDMRKARLRAH